MVTGTGWTAAAVDLSREERGAAHINTKWRKNFKVTIEKKRLCCWDAPDGPWKVNSRFCGNFTFLCLTYIACCRRFFVSIHSGHIYHYTIQWVQKKSLTTNHASFLGLKKYYVPFIHFSPLFCVKQHAWCSSICFWTALKHGVFFTKVNSEIHFFSKQR